MLLRFGVENHRSIKNYQQILLTKSKLKDVELGLIPVGDAADHEQIFASAVTVIYGANASGKSTMLHALSFAINQILYSHSRKSSREGITTHPFNSSLSSDNSLSKYDLDIILEESRYHYGFIINKHRVVQEWLYSIPIESIRKVKSVLFSRDGEEGAEDTFYFGKSLKGENRLISKLVRPNSLFISAAAQNSHPQISKIFAFFSEQVTERLDHSVSPSQLSLQLKKYFSENKEGHEKALKFLNAADIGIRNIEFTTAFVGEQAKNFAADLDEILKRHLPDDVSTEMLPIEFIHAHFWHQGPDGEVFKVILERESQGTISLLSLLGPIFDRLANGGVLILDELNSTLHPLVSRELIALFANQKSNPKGAQLIFTTHDTNLLCWKLLRRDQIWFAEKDDSGVSHFYSMAEIKVRQTDNLEKGYLAGRFGAVPFIGISDIEENIAN